MAKMHLNMGLDWLLTKNALSLRPVAFIALGWNEETFVEALKPKAQNCSLGH